MWSSWYVRTRRCGSTLSSIGQYRGYIDDSCRIPVIRPLCLPSTSALLSNSSRNSSSPWASCQLGPCMNARVRVPTKLMTTVEPARHSRLGGGGSSTMRRSIKERKVVETVRFVFYRFAFLSFWRGGSKLVAANIDLKAWHSCMCPAPPIHTHTYIYSTMNIACIIENNVGNITFRLSQF